MNFEEDEDGDESDFDEFGDNGDFDGDELDAVGGFQGTIPAEFINRWKETEFSLKVSEINHSIMQTAVGIASNSWFWRFRTNRSKLKSIMQVYYVLNSTIDEDGPVYE